MNESSRRQTEVLVIGTGIAGSTCALELATKGIDVTLITAADDLNACNTNRAQGGIVYKGKDDSPELLSKDIVNAGDEHNYLPAVNHLATHGPQAVEELLLDRYPVPFNREDNGELSCTQEGAHSSERILYHADYTGRSIIETLNAAVEKSTIKVLKNRTAIDILTTHHHARRSLSFRYSLMNRCVGAYVLNQENNGVETILAERTILATGGAGQVFLHTTNTEGSIGSGLAMAKRAGAVLRDVEFVQFHPTTFFRDPRSAARRFLISEAVRGEGAVLKNAKGQSFTKRYDPRGDLAPRDIVTRAILDELLLSGEPCVYLDATQIEEDPAERFPTIYKECLSHGIDMAKDPIPVVPAAHYNCGGILVDLHGHSTLDGLYAVGECSCTGVHGANRLASTSLLEGLLWGKEAAADIVNALRNGEMKSGSVVNDKLKDAIPDWQCPGNVDNEDPALIAQDWHVIKNTMWHYSGITRSTARLNRAINDLRNLHRNLSEFYRRTPISRPLIALFHGCETANIIAYGAYRNKESRGAHYRKD